MTTNIDILNDDIYVDDDIDFDNPIEVIMSLSLDINVRLNALEEYYDSKDIGDNAIEVLSTLSSMYQISGSKLIEQFFYRICTHGQISSFLKLEAAKSLLDYEEVEESCGDDEEEEENAHVRQRNIDRKNIGFKALDHVCYDLESMPAPCRVEAIYKLMESKEFVINSDAYFREFVRDIKIDCDFRYKTILSLENIGSTLMKQEITDLFCDKEFVSHLYESLEPVISKLFPKLTPNINSERFWRDVLNRLQYDNIRGIYKEKFPDKQCGMDYFIRKAQLAFLFHKPNIIYYRILAGQYLLQKCILTETKRFQVETSILSFANDKELDYDRRADAADVLLRLGSPSMKQHGRDVIMELGKVDGKVRTLFDNAQNVHTEEVEESVAEALEFMSSIPVYMINNHPIEFNYVNEQIEKMLKEDRECLKVEGRGKEYCDHCESSIDEKIESDEKNFCSNECLRFFFRDEKIRVALNRIFMDRALYSKFNNTLVNILLKVWTYLIDHENEQEMRKRMMEELEEMSGTCSTGFASRLINVISGFGQFNIRISWEAQIGANFTGRLNAAARNITNESSIFRNKKLDDTVELWLNREENKTTKEIIEKKLNPSGNLEKRPKTKEVITEFLGDNRFQKIDQCVEDFSEAVLNEMTITSSNYAARQNFSLFFRSYVSIVREELYLEFKNLISDSEFDMFFRQAIMQYDGDL